MRKFFEYLNRKYCLWLYLGRKARFTFDDDAYRSVWDQDKAWRENYRAHIPQ